MGASASAAMTEDEAASASAASGSPGGPSWPAKDLIGMTGDEAKAEVLAVDATLNVEVLPHDAIVTEDYRLDRVRIFVEDGKVVRQPTVG